MSNPRNQNPRNQGPQPDDKQAHADTELLVRYLDGQLSEQELAALNDRLANESALRHRLIDLMMQAQHIKAVVAQPDLDQIRNDLLSRPTQDPGHLSAHDLAAVGGYALQLALTSRPAKKLYAWSAVAATLLLAVTLLVVFTRDEPNESNDAPYAGNPATDSNEPGPVGPALSTPVATLTATHNATWAQASSAPVSLIPGSKLHPNQRLTLTAGFAEITTNDGAIAILEAPATVELLNNDNAIRLHAGKLVGLCHSDASKGFVVKTDHADITDLGTEFGVEVTPSQLTTTVFTGEVVLNTPGSAPQSLTENQTARVTDDGDRPRLSVQDHVAPGFARQMPGPANAAWITPVNVVASSTSTVDGRDYQAMNLINGTGLSAPGDPTAIHTGGTGDGTMWLSDNKRDAAVGASITFDLGSERDLAGAWIWNYNQDTASRRGLFVFDIYVGASGDPTATTLLVENAEVVRDGGSGSVRAQFEAFAAHGVRYIKFVSQATGNNDSAGLSEVRFAPAPEPATNPITEE